MISPSNARSNTQNTLCKLTFNIEGKEETLLVQPNTTLQSVTQQLLTKLPISQRTTHTQSALRELIKSELSSVLQTSTDQLWKQQIRSIIQGNYSSQKLTYFGYTPLSSRVHTTHNNLPAENSLTRVSNYGKLKEIHSKLFNDSSIAPTPASKPQGIKKKEDVKPKACFKKNKENTVFDKLYRQAECKRLRQDQLKETISRANETQLSRMTFMPKINQCSRQIVKLKDPLNTTLQSRKSLDREKQRLREIYTFQPNVSRSKSKLSSSSKNIIRKECFQLGEQTLFDSSTNLKTSQSSCLLQPSSSKPTRSTELHNQRKQIIFESIFVYLTCSPPQPVETFTQINKSKVKTKSIELHHSHIDDHPYLPPNIREVLQPMQDEMQSLDVTLDMDEFVWSLQRIHDRLEHPHSTALLAWGLKLLPQVN